MKKENDRYIKIVNSLLGAIIQSNNLLTNDGKVFMVILFKTVGFQKEKDWLIYKQICKYSGIKQKTRISESIKNLVAKKLIIKEGKYFKVNQNFESWLCLDSKNINVIRECYLNKKLLKSVTDNEEKLQNSVTEVTEKRNLKLHKSVTPSTDKTITDKTITDNDIYSRDGPAIKFLNEKENKSNKEQIDEIISYLNSRADKNFRAGSKSAIKNIKARLNEDFTLKDFKRVVDVKVASWKNTEYDKYLRPETLFGNKFESYLNEKLFEKNIKNGKSIKHFEYERVYTDEEQAKITRRFYDEQE